MQSTSAKADRTPRVATRRTRPPHPVLIVDDDRGAREALRFLLEVDGYPVVTARDGEHALAKLGKGLVPCLIVLDMNMPRVDGLEFRRRQMQEPRWSTIPVVFYSSGPLKRDSLGGLGVPSFEKPGDLDQVLKVVERHCVRAR